MICTDTKHGEFIVNNAFATYTGWDTMGADGEILSLLNLFIFIERLLGERSYEATAMNGLADGECIPLPGARKNTITISSITAVGWHS